MSKYFGTDGIRGRYGSKFVNESFAYALGQAIGHHLEPRTSLYIGIDTRHSGQSLAGALFAGYQSTGQKAVFMGVVPTPVVSFTVENYAPLSFGVMITASHNPADDNGFKVFGNHGRKMTVAEEIALEAHIDKALLSKAHPVASAKLHFEPSFLENYLYILKNTIDVSLRGKRIVLDTSNGAAQYASPVLLKAFGAELIHIGNAPDGQINKDCGSEHPQLLSKTVLEHQADIGFAQDGDGDRLIACMPDGSIVHGDHLLGFLALYATKKNKKLVVTEQSNIGLDIFLKQHGIDVIRTDVGDRNVFHEMVASKAFIGGEESGHIIFREHLNTGDGLLAMLKLLECLFLKHHSLYDFCKSMPLSPSEKASIHVNDKPPLETLPAFMDAMSAIRAQLGDRGRMVVRYSGTEPKIRLLVEHVDANVVQAQMKALKDAVRKHLPV
ncbi:MAG TPA: phosphoglucosamine mutase [Opitutae bacterium]|nr:phosphoglucosamine mutase [Opitutae bacterium]